MFKNKADVRPVLVVVAFSCLDFFMYFTASSVWVLLGYWLLMILPKAVICAWNHHHQHNFTFKSVALNRILEMLYAFHTGQTTHIWLLHHVLGHHKNYLDQSLDQSRWKRKNGETMGELEYSFSVALTSYYRAYQVGKTHPKLQKQFLTFGLLTVGAVLLLTLLNPVQGLFLFILPMLGSLLFTAWVTYDHHAGLDTDDPFLASHNIMSRGFNYMTGNLGYHTAHHYRQGMHWSLLPQLHEQIKENIPPELFVESTFQQLFPDRLFTAR